MPIRKWVVFDHSSAFRPTRLLWHNQKLFDRETTTPAPVFFLPLPSPCFQSATVYLMCRPFEIFTGNPSILLPMHPEKLLRPPTYVRSLFFCNIRAVLPHSSKRVEQLLKKAMPCDAPTHASLTKMVWITQTQFIQSN